MISLSIPSKYLLNSLVIYPLIIYECVYVDIFVNLAYLFLLLLSNFVNMAGEHALYDLKFRLPIDSVI